MLLTLNGIPDIGKSYYAKLLVEQEGFKVFSFPMTNNITNDLKKHEHIIDSYLQIGQDIVIVNSYFSIIAHNLEKSSYPSARAKVLQNLDVLPKLNSIDIFLIPKNVDNQLNNNYKMLFLIYFYMYHINPHLIEIDFTDNKCVSETWKQIKYIVEQNRRTKSSSL